MTNRRGFLTGVIGCALGGALGIAGPARGDQIPAEFRGHPFRLAFGGPLMRVGEPGSLAALRKADGIVMMGAHPSEAYMTRFKAWWRSL